MLAAVPFDPVGSHDCGAGGGLAVWADYGQPSRDLEILPLAGRFREDPTLKLWVNAEAIVSAQDIDPPVSAERALLLHRLLARADLDVHGLDFTSDEVSDLNVELYDVVDDLTIAPDFVRLPVGGDRDVFVAPLELIPDRIRAVVDHYDLATQVFRATEQDIVVTGNRRDTTVEHALRDGQALIDVTGMRRDVLTDVLLGTNEVVAVVAAAVGDDDRMLAIRQIQSHVHVCHWLAVLILYLAGEAQVVAVLTWSRAFSIEGQLGRRRRRDTTVEHALRDGQALIDVTGMRRDVLTDVLLGTNEVVAVVAAAVGDDDRMLAIRQIQSHVHVCHWLAVPVLHLAG